jgi:Cu+-exporting ATPase
LTTNREGLQQEALARMQQRCGQSGDLGIRLEGLSLHDLHPPQEVVPAYHDVTKAMEARDRQVNEAQAEALRKKRASEAAALQITRQAEAAAQEVVLQEQAARLVFRSRKATRTELPLREECRLLVQALYGIWSGVSAPAAYQAYQQDRHAALSRLAALTDFRLFWSALESALAGREKVLIDADNVPGRRHLLLLDPEQFRVPAPVLIPSERPSPSPRGNRSDTRGN